MKRSLFFALMVCFGTTAIAQRSSTRAQIEAALNAGNAVLADSLLQTAVNRFFANRQLDSLVDYTFYIGRVADKRSTPPQGQQAIDRFIQKLQGYKPAPRLLARIYAEAGKYLGSTGSYARAYEINKKAYQLTQSLKEVKPEWLAAIDTDMGTFAFRKGDVKLARDHHQRAIKVYMHSSDPDYESLYVAANNIGSQHWLASKLDSAIYYYNVALQALSKTAPTPVNKYHRPAVLLNNLAAVYNIQGQTKKAIDAMKLCIEKTGIYLSTPEDGPKRPNALSFRLEAIDNLGGIYKELGDYAQALSLEQYSYRQKLKNTGNDPAGVYKSQVLLGQLYLAMKDFRKAQELLELALKNISKSEEDLLFWQADACAALAALHEEQGRNHLATYYYERADSLYEASLQGDYDDIYFDFLRNASLFYATNGDLPKALFKAQKSFAYVKSRQGTETLLAFYQLLNLAEVNLLANQYSASASYSRDGLAIVERLLKQSQHQLDSVKIELKKPKAQLLKAKAAYALMSPKTPVALRTLLEEMKGITATLERRKAIIRDPKDIALMMQDQNELLAFTQALTLELYKLTGEQQRIDELLNLQESKTYSRIRARLDKSDSIRYAGVPTSIQQEERSLKAALSTALAKNNNHQQAMTAYFTAEKNWEAHLQRLKRDYPAYYRMRYQTVLTSLDSIQGSLPAATTVIRYFFIEQELYAVVIDKTTKKMISLPVSNLEKDISTVSGFSSTEQQSTAALYRLYNQLWAPIAGQIRNKRLIIIPDGVLFNLSFETLTPSRINNWSQLARNCLLFRHAISYHYSAALLTRQSAMDNIPDNFIAYAPGFLDKDKKRYISTIKDSFELDADYLTLLPQPFTVDFAQKAKSMMNGEAYLNDASTASSFRQFAGMHKIIHIGTHAESNNLSPQFSRLIFAKNADGPNSVYLHDIYNCDLRSKLAVLTACESGKPGFEDGEGMISLAHAFHYAGSESILTSLWKIDEQASMILMDAFYRHIKAGQPKDEALRLAKLEYLSAQSGRLLAPSYWAGLALMGDASPVDLGPSSDLTWLWWISGIVIGLVMLFFSWKKFIIQRTK